MSRWAWVTIAVVVSAGAVTTWYSYLLHAHYMSGLPEPDPDPRLLVLSAVPTGLFLAAGLFRRHSSRTQVAVAVAAVLVAALRISVIRTELAMAWTHGTGLFSGAAWVVGVLVAVVVLGVASVAAAWELAGGYRPAVRPRSPGHVEPGDVSESGFNVGPGE